MKIDKKILIFSPALFSLGETTRCIEIAKICRDLYDIRFISFGGEFEELIKKENFDFIKLEPQLTKKKVKHLYQIDRIKKIGYYFTTKEIQQQIQNEINLFKQINPVAIVTGFNFSNYLSGKICGIPLVSIGHTPWMVEAFYNQKKTDYMDIFDIPILNKYCKYLLIKLSKAASLWYCKHIVRPYNKVAKSYKLPKFNSFEDLWRGNYTLLSEPENFSDIKLPENYFFVGPLIAKLDKDLPKEILNISKQKPIIYFAMGSSGKEKVVIDIIKSFKNKDYTVIAPVKSKISKYNINIPENVIVTDWLPAHKVNEICDLSIIHGAIGTAMTTLYAGKPFIGIAMQPEQEITINCFVRKGVAIKIRASKFSSKELIKTIDYVINDEKIKINAFNYKKILLDWNKPDRVLKFFGENIN